MYVNAFWFGFLIAMVVMLILTLILAYIKGRQEENEEEHQPTEEEVREALEEITGKKFKVVEKNGYLVGEMIEEEEESDGKDENTQ
jgi:flagellar biosynthesis/type III secretory pathway M-ring protein FliF/YscJ